MKKYLLALALCVVFTQAQDDMQGAKKWSVLLGGGAGGQAAWLKNSDTNIQLWKNADELHGFSGGVSSRVTLGVQYENTQKDFTRYLLEASLSSGMHIASMGDLNYQSYGAMAEYGHRFGGRFYTLAGIGLSYAQIDFDDNYKRSGVGVNVLAGLGIELTKRIDFELVARGGFFLSDDFRNIGPTNSLSMPVKLDYMAQVNFRF
ncbi:outer membrane beta-barrel protein [uncultured Helicobacter sp.]|uniref:outer membrane beta-barrel protein n=1 Tax=uncultured Helicobacter sp. TaxID=175537 RepID=UPI00374F9F76